MCMKEKPKYAFNLDTNVICVALIKQQDLLFLFFKDFFTAWEVYSNITILKAREGKKRFLDKLGWAEKNNRQLFHVEKSFSWSD